MAYVNVLEWKAEQVAEWLQGLDDSIYLYGHYFINNNVTGRGLLNITVDDLYKLHVEKLGHQEIILEGLDHLRNLHHNLDTENLQYVCLKLSCKARSLYNELRLFGPMPSETKQRLDTASMSATADVLDALWTLIMWLDRPPFQGQQLYDEFKARFVKIGIELAASAQRDAFAEKPVTVIKNCCDELSNYSDALIQQVADSIILQPANLDIATVKRRTEDENFGLLFESSAPSGVHMISEVKFQSPAHQCGRVQPGDEIVQINYQTVVGWQLKKVLQLMDENPMEMILTLKKRPRHLPVFGQIYMKPFRIPARKNEKSHYFNNLPSPRAEFLVAPNIEFAFPKNKNKTSDLKDTSSLKSIRSTDLRAEADLKSSAVASTSGGHSGKMNFTDEDELDGDDLDDDLCIASGGGNISSRSMPGNNEANEDEDEDTEKSPTHSMRSVLSRPRSAPQRRATISGSSPPNFRRYINISEIWGHVPKSSQTSDGCGSGASTLRSNDSGHGTYEGSVSRDHDDVLLRSPHHHHQQQQPRPQTFAVGYTGGAFIDYSDPDYVSIFCQKPPAFLPPPIPSMASATPETSLTASSSSSSSATSTSTFCETDYVNLDADFNDLSLSKQPVPKPRVPGADEYRQSPNRKKPIPQPRTKSASHLLSTKSPSKSSSTAATGKEVCPIPTPQFKSFKRFYDPPLPTISPPPPPTTTATQLHQGLPDYINTTPPPPPVNPPPPLDARGTPRRSSSGRSIPSPFRSGHKSEAAGEAAIPPPALPQRQGHSSQSSPARSRSSLETSPRATPYYMSDVYHRSSSGLTGTAAATLSSPSRSQLPLPECEYVQCDPAVDTYQGSSSPPPPPIPERHYDLPYHHLQPNHQAGVRQQQQLSKKSSNS